MADPWIFPGIGILRDYRKEERIKMPRTITALSSQLSYAVLFFDALDENRSETLKRQVNKLFRKTEHCYQRLDEFDPAAQAQALVEILRKRIVEEHSLIDTHYQYNLAFFEEADRLNGARLEAIIALIKQIKRELNVPGLQLFSYLCVCKHGKNTTQAMENFDVCTEKLVRTSDLDMPRLVLIDGLPLSDTEMPIRAAVLALNVLSCTNQLSQQLKGMDRSIWNWSMTEFDVQAQEKAAEEKKWLEKRLNGEGAFPWDRLVGSFNKLCETIIEENKLTFPVNRIPVPEDVVGCLFQRKKKSENIPAFEKTVEKLFYENITCKLTEKLERTDWAAKCAWLLRRPDTEEDAWVGIPVRWWKETVHQLMNVKLNSKSNDATTPPRFSVALHVTAKADEMRRLVGDAFKDGIKMLDDWIPVYIKAKIIAALPAFINENERKEANAIKDEETHLDAMINIATDAQDYLQRLPRLCQQAMSVSYYDIAQNTYLLISNDTYSIWGQYDESLTMQCPVYNFHSLWDFEFQTLVLAYWSYDRYYANNREFIFRQR